MTRPRLPRVWVGRAAAALVAALAANTLLSRLEVDHDPALITLLALATVAALTMFLQSVEASVRLPWTAPRADARPDPGEDTRTAMYRHLVEAHQTSHEADDAVVWQLADLAARRLRQVHGLRYADDPARVHELLGPLLAEWLSHDRRNRYHPDQRHPRYSVAQLCGVIDRIEAL